jgi:hypothetical protein
MYHFRSFSDAVPANLRSGSMRLCGNDYKKTKNGKSYIMIIQMNCAKVMPLNTGKTPIKSVLPPTPSNVTTWLLKHSATPVDPQQLHILDKSIRRLTHSIPPLFVVLPLYYFAQLPEVTYTLPTLYATYCTLLVLTFKFHSDLSVGMQLWAEKSGIEKAILIKNEWLLFELIPWNVSMDRFQCFLKTLEL